MLYLIDAINWTHRGSDAKTFREAAGGRPRSLACDPEESQVEVPRWETRKRHGGTPSDLPPDEPYDFRNFRSVRRLGDGEATPNELDRLRRTLGELYPDTFGDHEPETPETAIATILPPVVDTEVFEKFVVEHQVWPALRGLSFVEQRRYVRQCPSWTPALFDFLHRRSREEGRRDRQRGIELSQLALDSLDGNEDRLGERIHSLRAQGWAWLGNARRLALEFLAADTALRKADLMLQAGEGRSDPFASGIVSICKGTLRMFQRRHEEALGWFDSALMFFRTASVVPWQIRALISRSSTLIYQERYQEVTAPLRQADALLAEAEESLPYILSYSIVNGLVKSDAYHEAETRLASLQEKYPQPERTVWRCQELWLGAKIDHALGRLDSAEEKYHLGLGGLKPLKEPLYEALLSLDLAVLYSEARRLAEVIEISVEILPVFESIKLYDETLASLGLFSAAVARGSIPTSTLRKVRIALERDPLLEAMQKRSQGDP